MNFGKIIVWIIVGALAGNLTGRLVTFSKEGLGRWTNLGIGMVGAVVGGFLFSLFNIDLGLGELKVTFEDLLAAVVGSLICLATLWGFRKYSGRKAKAPRIEPSHADDHPTD